MSKVPQAPPNIDKRVGEYVALRDKLREIEAEYEEKKKPYRAALDKLGGVLMEFLESTGSEAIRTEHGTCHTTTRTSASVADGEAFLKFVIDTERYELLDRRANATAVKAYVTEHGNLPPGCNLSSVKTIGVRRA